MKDTGPTLTAGAVQVNSCSLTESSLRLNTADWRGTEWKQRAQQSRSGQVRGATKRLVSNAITHKHIIEGTLKDINKEAVHGLVCIHTQ